MEVPGVWCVNPGVGDVQDSTPRSRPLAHLFWVSSLHFGDLGIEFESGRVALEKRNDAGLTFELLIKRRSESFSEPTLSSRTEREKGT